MKAARVQADRATRGMNSAAATLRLFTAGPDAETLGELAELQRAAWQEMSALQRSWIEAWDGWWRYTTDEKGLNTMSKLAEHLANSTTQAINIVGDQLTSLVELQENIEVSYAYWVSQKV